jgi:hypothetical protein
MRILKGVAALAIAGLAMPAAAENVSPLLAKVEANRLTHAGESIRIRVPKSAAYAGAERFNLYGVADAEVHVFVEAAADRRIRRLYWIQFESYLPSRPELSYDYADGNRKSELEGITTWLRSGPASTAGPTRPGSDREHVTGILKRAGYGIPPEVMNVRMVQILDDPAGTGKGRRELMVIYSEDLALTGKSLANLTKDGKPSEQWAPLEQALIKRATEAVSIKRQ